ncbi:MAG: histidine kinase [Oscillospiraceae bacterium]|nr:histidine kinase [Oscillospiraceae bacterium]
MKYQTKILVAYITIVIIIVSAIAGIFYWYNTSRFMETAYQNMLDKVERMALQIDNQLTFMDATIENLMSDAEFMDAIQVMGGTRPPNPRDKEWNVVANQRITSALYRYPLNKYIYRVNYFNRNMDFYSSRFYNRDTVRLGTEKIFAAMSWLPDVDAIKPKRYITAVHNDPWLKEDEDENQVFSVIRGIYLYGVDVGYLEVQMELSMLLGLLNVSEEDQGWIIMVAPDGRILYHNMEDDRDLEQYLRLGQGVFEEEIAIGGSNGTTKEFIASTIGPYSKIQVLIVSDQEFVLAPQASVGQLVMLISIGILSIAFFYVYSWSVHLTKPFHKLRQEMKRIELTDLTESEAQYEVPEGGDKGKDDIKALGATFYQLINRLSAALKNELKARELQMQANFDSLQAQINPHFIFNVLNVLSNRGMLAGDELICETCASIADMLRYSTSTQSKTAAISAELAHVENYLTLLQMRYEHRLRYHLKVEEGLLPIQIPKIVLQPFVENAVTHGYRTGNKDMMITIIGCVTERGWFLEVRDNGGGFEKKNLRKIQESLRAIDEKLASGMGNMLFSLGGMGISGTYARLKTFLPNIQFTIGNNPDGGAFVRMAIGRGIPDAPVVGRGAAASRGA